VLLSYLLKLFLALIGANRCIKRNIHPSMAQCNVFFFTIIGGSLVRLLALLFCRRHLDQLFFDFFHLGHLFFGFFILRGVDTVAITNDEVELINDLGV
jgi:hypothetical protein